MTTIYEKYIESIRQKDIDNSPIQRNFACCLEAMLSIEKKFDFVCRIADNGYSDSVKYSDFYKNSINTLEAEVCRFDSLMNFQIISNAKKESVAMISHIRRKIKEGVITVAEYQDIMSTVKVFVQMSITKHQQFVRQTDKVLRAQLELSKK